MATSTNKKKRLPDAYRFAGFRRPDEIEGVFGDPDHKASPGFVEGLDNETRVIQRRSYGLRDEPYLRLKILTCMLPRL